MRSLTCGASETCGPGSPSPRFPQGPSGTSQVTGPSVAAAPWSSTPPSASSPSPNTGDDNCCLQGWQTPGHPEAQSFRGRIPHGSTARLPTHQPGSCLPDCKADCRPAGLGFGRAGLAPAGRHTEFAEVTARLPPSGPALPGRNCHAFADPVQALLARKTTAKACYPASSTCFRGGFGRHYGRGQDPRKHGTHGTHGTRRR